MKYQEEKENAITEKIILISKMKELQNKFILISPKEEHPSCMNIEKCSFIFRNEDPECFRCIYCGMFEQAAEKNLDVEPSSSLENPNKEKDVSTSEIHNISNSKTDTSSLKKKK